MDRSKLTNSKFGMYYGANQNAQAKAVDLRKRRTNAELILWEAIKSEKVLGIKFRQQHPVAHFIVDFYCHSLKLVIELDGSVHNSEEAKEYDENRTAFLNDLGIKVIRFTNQQAEQHLELVIKEIETAINEIKGVV